MALERGLFAHLGLLAMVALASSGAPAARAGTGKTAIGYAVQVATGKIHTCALTTAGAVKCWGWNGAGQLGDGTSTQRLAPVDVTGLDSGVRAVKAGREHTCAITSTGGVKCWGYNNSYQLGDGSTSLSRNAPVAVAGLSSGIVAIAAGSEHNCALNAAGMRSG